MLGRAFSYSIALMTSLRSQLTDLAQSFATQVIAALRGTSLDDLLSAQGGRRSAHAPADSEAKETTRTRSGRQKAERLPRRSTDDIAKSLDLVTKLVKSQPKGLRAEEIRKKLGLEVREMPRILKEGLAKKKLKSKGQKRATTYFAA